MSDLTALLLAITGLVTALGLFWGIVSSWRIKKLESKSDALHEKTVATDKALAHETGRNDLIVSTATAADRTARDAAIVTKQMQEQMVNMRIDNELIKELVKTTLQERAEDKANLLERDKIIAGLREELKSEKERRLNE